MGNLLAPNGKPSNLTPEQYKLVRSPEFKAWFGDWENSPETSSKVVDENGEPLICYHGTFREFNVFEWSKDGGFYFTEFSRIAEIYATSVQEGKLTKTPNENPIVLKCFLNFKNPLRERVYGVVGKNKRLINIAIKKGYDSLIISGGQDVGGYYDQYVTFESNQIKLADGTNNTFDGNNPDIRFVDGGGIDENEPLVVSNYILNRHPIKGDVFQGGKVNGYKIVKFKKFKKHYGIIYEILLIDTKANTDGNFNKRIVGYTPQTKKISDFNQSFLTATKGKYYTIWSDSEIDEKFKKGGKVDSFGKVEEIIINPTEIECHSCHWKWKVKDGGDDLFICHKCNYDNSKFYKFEGLEGKKILDSISYAKGGRTISQTPAPKKDQIKGSDKNKEGSAKDISSAKKIKFSDDVLEKIQNSVDKHNEKHPNKKITLDSAKAVVRRGMGAYSSTHRPTISGGNENSRVAWGLARLNAFTYKIINGKSKSGKYSQDNDLIEELAYKFEKYADGGEISNIMRNEIIDILSKNERYGKQILSVQEVGLEIIQSCIESNTYFGNSIKQANDNYIMIPVKYEDKLWAIDKKVEYVYFAKPNENTKISVEYKYDMQEYPAPVLFDSEIMNNEEFYDVNDYEEINVREFDSEFLYRGINKDEMLSIIENGFIKSNASMNIGEQQANTTSFAQDISQASNYAVGFNAWYDDVTFAKPKYILKVKKEGVNYKPTIETDIQNEVDVFGEIPIQQIDSIYEIKLGECKMGSVEINVGYKNDFSDGSRYPMFKKVFVRKTDINTLINEINSKNKIEKNNDMTNSNPKDTITMDIPLLIRFAELMREDIKTDVALHQVIENLLDIKDKGVLTMNDYESIVGNVTGLEEDKVEEPKMEEGGKVKSIHSQKGDIMVSLDDNWYSDDSSVELVPVSELIKFREFDRKVSPKYNQDNSIENINHLKFMFQKEGVKSPLIIEYSADDSSVLIIEGNHRLNSAIDLGMEYLPARVVLKKHGNYSPAKIKNAMKVDGIKANSSNYIPSDLKPSYIGIAGAKPIAYAEGGIIEGRLHSECGDDGCGRKFQVGENGHIIEAERDEAVIVADAFNDNKQMTIEGTPSEIASALNVVGGGKNFNDGAKIVEGGTQKEVSKIKAQATDTDVDDVIDSGSIIINRRSMADEKSYKVTGSAKQIASAINSINGNGVVIEKGAKIE